MKVRVGYGLGTAGATLDDDRFGALVDALEHHRFDSLWLSERVTGETPDPLVGLAYAAGRTRRLKLGTSVLVVPGRNPVLLAKELASLDRLSNGRLLPAFGLGIAEPAEQQAFGVARADRAAWFDEAVPLIRRLWLEDAVDHEGARFRYRGAVVRPKPVQTPPDVWLGGRAPSELRRVGRLGDGWLASFVTPADAAAGRVEIEKAASDAGRIIDDEHWGVLVPYVADGRAGLPTGFAERVAARRPDVDPADLAPVGLAAVARHVRRFVDEGFSKFVLVPIGEPASWDDELAALASEVLPLETSKEERQTPR